MRLDPASARVASDRELMAGVRDGDLERMGELFERHHARLFGFFTKLTRDRAAAEDLVQEVFTRMLKYRHSYRPDAEFEPWMFALVRNAARNHFRGRRRESPGLPGEEPIDEDSPASELERRDDLRRLDAALARLDPAKREILLFARFSELRYDQIGELLGISVGAVKVRVHRALKDLAAAYGEAS